MVDVKNDIKRTYYLPEPVDIEVKVRAARDRMRPSDVVRMALESYLGLEKKGKR
ncbi:MAG: hypothetical protein WBE68_11985 [Candidatus Nitrosopolaris sp.]|jgi:hypothetical protein